MAAILTIAVYGLALSGHFPREFRGASLVSPLGATILWASATLIALSAALALLFAYGAVPWYAAVIGGGFMLLVAPYVLIPFPDRFVNGRAALVVFTALALLLDLEMLRRLL